MEERNEIVEIKEEQPKQEETTVEVIEPSFCVNCGGKIENGALFCPKCGHKVGEKVGTIADVTEKPSSKVDTANTGNRKGKKLLLPILGAAAVVVVIAVAFFIIRGTQAKSVTLNKDSVTVKVDEDVRLSYTIDPENTKNKTVTWSSSNNSIAVVNDGVITGVNEGDCVITITTKNGKTDTCTIIVEPAGPDFDALYNEYCQSSFAEVGSDGSYLSIDTNPYDIDDYFDSEAYQAVLAVVDALELPDSLVEDMGRTTSLMGRQNADYDEVSVSWSYHPDHGLEVLFKLK